jgi:HTH-type transcriptional regulator, sugar sensing transcriptional regulator
MLTKQLKDSGLKEKEANIYDILLEHGTLPVLEIIKKSGLKRGIVYKTLYDLQDKGLASQQVIKKKLHFRAEHPYKLSELVEEQLKQAQNYQLTLQTYLPQLISAFKTSDNKPGVKIFEGIQGIKEVYNDTLKEGKEIWAILQTSEVEPKVYEWLSKTYGKKRATAGIWAKVIAAEDVKTKMYVSKNELEKRETRVVPKEKFPIGIEVDIYGSKVAFINFHKDGDLVGIIVQNDLIANTMRAMFLLAWEKAGDFITNL